MLRWRNPQAKISRMQMLKYRHKALRIIENWFDNHDFLQVDMPVLIKNPNPEPQFNIFSVSDNSSLSTSPELQMKRMLAGGFDKIVSIGHCFRNNELDQLHNPEFTMIEWYRVNSTLDTICSDIETIWQSCFGKFPALDKNGILTRTNKKIDMSNFPYQRIAVHDLIKNKLDLDIKGIINAQELYAKGKTKGLFYEQNENESFEELFTRLWILIEDNLGKDQPLFVKDWPAPLASLAKLKENNPTIAERIELIVDGIEITNGFNELLSATEYKQRFSTSIKTRADNNLQEWDFDEKFLQAMRVGMPPAAGCAMGFDRLCQLLTGAENIKEVLPFSFDEI